MPSTFSWLDTSAADRRRALDVIDLFRPGGTVDELGIGTIRDAIADLFFPGTSTIQTRARYLLFVPWMYRRLEGRGLSASDVARVAREEELRLVDVLAASADSAGTIGIEARRALKRLPSAVYWGGLGTLGIRLFPGTQDLYQRSFDRIRASREGSRRNREERDAPLADIPTWDPHLPPPTDDFPAKASLALTAAEGRYLQERIRARASGTMLAFLADVGAPWKPVDFPWDHPAASNTPAALSELLHHARCFSELLQGASTLYNVMLAEAATAPGRAEARDRHHAAFATWGAKASERSDVLRVWNRPQFWQIVLRRNPRIPMPTRSFVEQWCDLAIAVPGPSLRDDPRARELIDQRELYLKGPKARLHHREYLELWGGDSGSAQLEYRWGIAQTLLNDILRSLTAGASDAHAA
jgi:hypothetical protein